MRQIAVFLLFLFTVSIIHAQDDGIPNNCPFTGGVFYQQNWFIRAANARTTVVDWSSGADVRILSDQRSGADVTVGKWSPECRYAAVSYGTPDDSGRLIYTTVIFDVVNGGEVAVFENARHIPYPITWDTNSSRILVETRFGAYLHYIGGGDVWLTSEADGNSRAFRAGSVSWDYAANQVIGVLTIPPFGSAAYDMGSGQLVGLTDQFNRPEVAAQAALSVQGRENGEKYRCLNSLIKQRAYRYRDETVIYSGPAGNGIENARALYQADQKRIVLVDRSNNEIIRVLVEDADYVQSRNTTFGWQDGCTKLSVNFYPDTILFDLVTGERTVVQPQPRTVDFNAPLGCRFNIIYQPYNNEVKAIDVNDRDNFVLLESGVDVEVLEFLGRSIGCRYAAADIAVNGQTDTVIYDLATQKRVSVVPDAVGLLRSVDWSPDDRHVLVHTRNGGILIDLGSGAQIAIASGAVSGRAVIITSNRFARYTYYPTTRSFTQLDWDTSRGLLFGVPANQPDHVLVFDVHTGAVVGSYNIAGSTSEVNFLRYDGKIFVYTHHNAATLAPGTFGMAVWDVESAQGVQLATARPLLPLEGYETRFIAQMASPQFSPDGRYMLMRGQKYLYVWDFSALSGTAPHLPNYIHMPISTRAARFVDNGTIETLAPDPVYNRRTRDIYYYRYDVVSGALVSQETVNIENDYFKFAEIPN